MTAVQDRKQAHSQEGERERTPLSILAWMGQLPFTVVGALQRRFSRALGGVALAHIAAQSTRTADPGFDDNEPAKRLPAGLIT